MTTTTETLKINVSGNAARELDKIDRKLTDVGASAGGASNGLGKLTGDAASGAALGAMGAAIGVAITAYAKLGEVIVSSLSMAVEKNAEAKAASDALSRSWDNMHLALGNALLGPDGGAALFGELEGAIAAVTVAVKANGDAIGTAFASIMGAVRPVVTVLSVTLQAALTPLALAIDGVVVVAETLYAGFLGLKAAALIATEGLATLGNSLGMVSDEALADLKTSVDQAARDFEDFKIETAGASEALWDAGNAIRDVGSAASGIGSKLDPLEKMLGDLATKAQASRKALVDLLALSPEELAYMSELNQQTRENEASAKALLGIGLEEKKATASGTAVIENYTEAQWADINATLMRTSAIRQGVAEIKAMAAADDDAASRALTNAAAEDAAHTAHFERLMDLNAREVEASNARAERIQGIIDLTGVARDVAEQLADAEGMSTDKTIENYARVKSALDSLADGFAGISASSLQMGVDVAMGQGSLGDLGRSFAKQLGGLFVGIGTGLIIAGSGLKALLTGNFAGAIPLGIGLVGAGLALGAIGNIGAGGGGGAKTASGAASGADLGRAADNAPRAKADKAEQTIVVQIGTREIARELRDMQRRGEIG